MASLRSCWSAVARAALHTYGSTYVCLGVTLYHSHHEGEECADADNDPISYPLVQDEDSVCLCHFVLDNEDILDGPKYLLSGVWDCGHIYVLRQISHSLYNIW